MSVLNVNPAITPIFHNNKWLPLATINNRLYISDSEVERDEFDNYWNDRPAAMQDGNGCRTMFISAAIIICILAFILCFTACTPKAPTLDKNRGKKVKPTLAADTATHRPRYNHWAKPFEL
jgi:hypothetical protein